MKIETIYAFSLAAIFAILTILEFGQNVGYYIALYLSRAFRKRLQYPLVFRRRRSSSYVSRLDCICILIYLAGNIFCSTIWARGWSDVATRSGTLFIINLVPLMFGGRTSFFVDKVLNVGRDRAEMFHRWAGRICVLEGCMHGSINIINHFEESRRMGKPLLALLPAVFLCSVLPFRSRFYEIFLGLHFGLVVTTVALLWVHLALIKSFSLLMLTIASTLWAVDTIIGAVIFLYRNRGLCTSTLTVETLENSQHAARVWVVPARRWTCKPGQYVYIKAPDHNRHNPGILQSHPYLVAWKEAEEGEEVRVLLLVEKQAGFSIDLCNLPGNSTSVWLQGPYGRSFDLSRFEKVVFFTDGVGIAGQLMHIETLLKGRESKTAKTRRISLIWFLDYKGQDNIANDILEKLIVRDGGRILWALIYVPVPALTSSSSDKHSDPDTNVQKNKIGLLVREWVFTSSPFQSSNIAEQIRSEWGYAAGDMAVCVCGHATLENKVREAVCSIDKDIHLFNSEFHPEDTPSSLETRKIYHE